MFVPIAYLTNIIPREPVARLEQRFGAHDGEIYLNRRVGRIRRACALGLIHRQ
jgi:hypothetical protein